MLALGAEVMNEGQIGADAGQRFCGIIDAFDRV